MMIVGALRQGVIKHSTEEYSYYENIVMAHVHMHLIIGIMRTLWGQIKGSAFPRTVKFKVQLAYTAPR